MRNVTTSDARPGRLLVATPTLVDPHFKRSVVLLLGHDDDGTLGVILNRPTSLRLNQILAGWGAVVAGDPVVFEGGPVSTDSALAVAAAVGDGPAGGWRRLVGNLGLVDLDADPGSVGSDLAAMRVFAGYAGWSAGQLDAEVADGAWYTAGAHPSDIFSDDPVDLWRRVLRRQPPPLSYASTYPEDVSLN
jgi:putative transcriptional regulator